MVIILIIIIFTFLRPLFSFFPCINIILQSVQKVTQPMEKCNINFIFLLLCLFLIISAENVHHYALHRDAHDESC
jgi:sterol desaturase/sphingolipid hydroxylase (fatty acid hydroxylase superfamily)